ncbi:MAG: hypothetical protein CL677_02545 [Bdellovibrionaceae bacterium]|nr:hypothetical protein [Pseudobdellovibrionaceae bacterium]|tara:strand:- start:284999 stop:285712 length:714 start_codon:yes stop_codon:yes gene_type:complete
MKSILITIVSIVTLGALANANERQVRRIERLTAQIQQDVRYTQANQRDLRDAIQHLRQALDLINSQVTPAPPRPVPPRPEPPSPRPVGYTCVPRDNDGRAPYAIAIRDSNFDVQKSRHIYGSMTDCNQAIDRMRYIDGVKILCGSRDYDGRAPYSVFRMDGVADVRFTGLGFSTVQECENTLNDRVRFRRGSYVTCSSRDADGRAPWSIFAINFTQAQVERKSETFNTYNDCRSQLH